MIEVQSPFDAAMIEEGPPAVFTIDEDGRLSLDDMRTREHWCRVDAELCHEPCH